MKTHMNDLIVAADINDPIVKRNFEDGQGMWKQQRIHRQSLTDVQAT